MSYSEGSGPYHAFIYSGGVITDLAAGTPQENLNSWGQGINASGQIAGCMTPVPPITLTRLCFAAAA